MIVQRQLCAARVARSAPGPPCGRVCAPMARGAPGRSTLVTAANQSAAPAATTTVDPAASAEPAVQLFPTAAAGHFIDNNTSFVQEFPVRGYEVAPDQQASMVTIANLLQVGPRFHGVVCTNVRCM